MSEKYKEMYEQARELSIADALTLTREADTDEERSFYTLLLNWHFQMKHNG